LITDKICPSITSTMTKIGADLYYIPSPNQVDWTGAINYCTNLSPELRLPPVTTFEEYDNVWTVAKNMANSYAQT